MDSSFIGTAQLRKIFLNFFEQHGHKIVGSSSLVPVNDSSLFFTNAGMVQFKGVFLGIEQRDYRRATTVQRCLRASGKHNDLENVGYTTRHHTFFEMLGNFSFGDYFKAEAIHLAWSLLTERLQLPAERLWVTVHQDDHEAEQLWRAEFERSGRKAQGISQCGDHDNFWSMGDTGPCGYCSEIFYDHGEQFAGDPPGGAVEGERYIEIWNLVFMQFERDGQGGQDMLPRPSIDTGIGLERLAAVIQGVHDNYDIDLFKSLLADFAQILSKYTDLRLERLDKELYRIASRVAADHIRATVFLLAEGVLPSNDKHGYVLRSIMRRALFYLYQLGIRSPLFYHLVPSVVRVMGDAYPELDLTDRQQQIMELVLEEEKKFLITIGRGIELLKQELPRCQGGVLSGAVAFRMHDTYGLPLALSSELAKQAGLQVDQVGFEEELERQRVASRRDLKSCFKTDSSASGWLNGMPATHYVEIANEEDVVVGTLLAIGGLDITKEDKPLKVDSLAVGEEAGLILSCSGFYAESGGAVGDRGYLVSEDNSSRFRVTDTKKCGDIYMHYGVLEQGALSCSMRLVSKPDIELQMRVRANHSATHLLQASLRRLLGSQVVQRGSLVSEGCLRFDFAYNEPLTAEQCEELERLVNQAVWSDLPVTISHMSLTTAKESGAMALFGESYGEEVRVVKIGDLSMELCGGLHVFRTGLIGGFRIEQESGVAAGVRRIIAVTRLNALQNWQSQRRQLTELGSLLSVDAGSIFAQVKRLMTQNSAQRQQLINYQQQRLAMMAKQLWQQREEVEVARTERKVQLVLAGGLHDIEVDQLRYLWDQFKSHTDGVVFLQLLVGDRQHWLVGVGRDLSFCNANKLLQQVMRLLGGKGGGRSDMAQGSAPYDSGEGRLTVVTREWLRTLLQQNLDG